MILKNPPLPPWGASPFLSRVPVFVARSSFCRAFLLNSTSFTGLLGNANFSTVMTSMKFLNPLSAALTPSSNCAETRSPLKGTPIHLSKMQFHLSKMQFHLSKTQFNLSKTQFHLSKMQFNLSKMQFNLSKMQFDLSKMQFNLSRMVLFSTWS